MKYAHPFLVGVLWLAFNLAAGSQPAAVDWPGFLARSDMEWPELPRNYNCSIKRLGTAQAGRSF